MFWHRLSNISQRLISKKKTWERNTPIEYAQRNLQGLEIFKMQANPI
jgi:hypothetical protein